MKSVSNIRAGVIFALLTATGLGAITTQAKIIYADGGNAMTVMFTRFLISTLVFGLLLAFKRQSFQVDRQLRLPVIAVGFVWSGAMICYLLSVESISVSVAVLLLYSYPLLVLIYSILSGQLSASPLLVLVFFIAFLGLYLALSGGEVKLGATGLVLALLAGLGAAFTFIKGAQVAPRLSPLLLTFWINAIGLLMIMPLVYTQFSLPASTTGLVSLGAATLFYIIAILCQFQALARLRAATAAFILNLEPVVSILLASIILKEQLSNLQWLGVILVISVLVASVRIKSSHSVSRA
ncbi:MAG: EamA family transporter [Gammaproteobacteria bacterium]